MVKNGVTFGDSHYTVLPIGYWLALLIFQKKEEILAITYRSAVRRCLFLSFE